jgi:hypothetical protein
LRNRPGGCTVYRAHLISGQRETSDTSLKGAPGILSSRRRSPNAIRDGHAVVEKIVIPFGGRFLRLYAIVRFVRII